jgi:excinuclease ABC subunit A
MDKPQVDAIEGIPPAIAIDQTNPVRTSRSTVGTMTELNDHLKLLFARCAAAHCRGCGQPVRRDAPSICARSRARAGGRRSALVIVCFPVPCRRTSAGRGARLLARQGYTRIVERAGEALEVVQDRLRAGARDRSRLVERSRRR